MRFRITFAKTNAMRFTSHLDLQRTWERTIRRARLPLSYSQGFNPHPKINLAAALPLGFTSRCEMVEIWLEDETLENPGGVPGPSWDGYEFRRQATTSEVESGEEAARMNDRHERFASEVKAHLRDSAPPGIEILQVEVIGHQEPKIQTLVDSAIYEIILDDPVADLETKVKALLSQEAILRERRGKEYDLRPLIESIDLIGFTPSGEQQIRVALAARPGSTGRPDEVLAALEIEPYQADVQRTVLVLKA
jgi:uncharacterized protein (DUF2344 family)